MHLAHPTHLPHFPQKSQCWKWWCCGVGSPHGGSTYDEPVQVGTLTNWSVCSAGTGGGHAIKQDGTLWGWGYNAANGSGSGSIGDQTTTNRTSPVQVQSDTDWLDLPKPQYGCVHQATQHVIAVKEA